MVIFSKILNHVYQKNNEVASPKISKYALQLFYFISKNAGAFKEMDIVEEMNHWTGTKKYGVSRMGSPTSFVKILEQLKSLKLVKTDLDGRFSLTELGKQFQQYLHKDCLDMDLPARLSLWLMDQDGQRKMEDYLGRYFGKAKTFFGTKVESELKTKQETMKI